jgi:hypothetical protein
VRICHARIPGIAYGWNMSSSNSAVCQDVVVGFCSMLDLGIEIINWYLQCGFGGEGRRWLAMLALMPGAEDSFRDV